MIIEIKQPVLELEADILTCIPSTKRIKSDSGYYIITLRASKDIFTNRVTIFVHNTIHTDIHLNYVEGKDCMCTEICTEDYYDLREKEVLL